MFFKRVVTAFDIVHDASTWIYRTRMGGMLQHRDGWLTRFSSSLCSIKLHTPHLSPCSLSSHCFQVCADDAVDRMTSRLQVGQHSHTACPLPIQSGIQMLFEIGVGRCTSRTLNSGTTQTLRNRNELPTTLTDDRLIAAAAIIGDRTKPKNGYNRPAAMGMPRAL